METLTHQALLSGKLSAAWKQVLTNLALISAGCIIFVLGMKGLLIPKGFLSGGLVGVALIFHYIFPWIDVGLAYFILNIPLAILGWFGVSGRFLLYSLFGACFFSLMAHLIRPEPVQLHDPILAALFAGVICGLGAGLILKSVGSAGGLDILAVYLNKRFGLRIGPLVFAANTVVLSAGAVIFDLEKALYSIIFLYTNAKVIDLVLAGFNRRKSLLIISDRPRDIAERILKKVNRGVTVLKGQGAYSGLERDVLFTVAPVTELSRLKQSIFEIDPNAFVVINDTMEVIGKRHGKIKTY